VDRTFQQLRPSHARAQATPRPRRREACSITVRLDADGTIVEARIVPPTSQNQASIEEDLVSFIGGSLDLPEDAFTASL